MNRSSIRKSFLDDLLNDDDPIPLPSATSSSTNSMEVRQQQQQQRTKSVRFLDGDDSDDILGSLLPASASSSIGVSSRSSRQDGLEAAASLANSGGVQQHQGSRGITMDGSRTGKQESGGGIVTVKPMGNNSNSSSGSKSDWLGLASSDGVRNRDEIEKTREERTRSAGLTRSAVDKESEDDFVIPGSTAGSMMKKRDANASTTADPSWLTDSTNTNISNGSSQYQQQQRIAASTPASLTTARSTLLPDSTVTRRDSVSGPTTSIRGTSSETTALRSPGGRRIDAGEHPASASTVRRSSDATAALSLNPSASSIESSLLLLQTQVPNFTLYSPFDIWRSVVLISQVLRE